MARREPGFWERLREAFTGRPPGGRGRGARAGMEAAGDLGVSGAAEPTGVRPGKPGTAGAEKEDGVYVSPTPVTLGEDVTIRYQGFLSREPGAEVYLHYGFGPGPWKGVRDVKMSRQTDGSFVCKIRAEDEGSLVFCFRDQHYRWDNNRGRNWSQEIHTGRNPTVVH